MRIGLFLLQERSISCCVKRSRFFFTRVPCDTSVVLVDGVSSDINSVYLYPSRNY